MYSIVNKAYPVLCVFDETIKQSGHKPLIIALGWPAEFIIALVKRYWRQVSLDKKYWGGAEGDQGHQESIQDAGGTNVRPCGYYISPNATSG